jgi:hypothetical protein
MAPVSGLIIHFFKQTGDPLALAKIRLCSDFGAGVLPV